MSTVSTVPAADDAEELLARQTEVLERIASAEPLPDVLEAILCSLEALMPSARCSVLLLDREAETLHHAAAPRLPAPYIAGVDGMSIGESAGSCGTAAKLNAPVVATDVRTDERWECFRELAADAGLRSCWSTPIAGRDGAPVGTFAVYHDEPHTPTAREQMLVGRFTHLAAVAIDHARLLEERRARLEAETARRTAEELASARADLLAAVGHEARTPIQAIVGFAELLGTIDLEPERQREALGHIGAAAEHVMDLLSDVLDLSRIEAKSLPLRREPIALAEVMDEVIGLVTPQAEQRSCALTHSVDSDVVVTADRRRLRQVLLNVVTNALRHGRSGGVVAATCHLQPGAESVLLEITDDGPGIPVEVLPRIFTPYARAPEADPAQEAQHESIGLGLALAYELARAMGGDLAVGHTSERGTAMHLRLPTASARL